MMPGVVVDTNTFIAAGFNKRSMSARVIEAVRLHRLRLVWNEATRAETRRIAEKIPPIRWTEFEGLFTRENCHEGAVDESGFDYVPDPSDRKFAALAAASDAVLITQDDHLLRDRGRGTVRILTPREFVEYCWPAR